VAQILMIYSSTDGHTLKICRRLKSLLEAARHEVDLVAITEVGALEPSSFDRVVIGASIRYGHHGRAVIDFIERNLNWLQSRPSAFFSVNLVARKPNKRSPVSNPYVRKFLRKIDWKPTRIAVFAGKLDYPRYSVLDRWMIRLIMGITGGPTDPESVVEFTDWQQVDAFGHELAEG
jgi:menaquinone-dependent protoporphyrinogen oxidase